MNSYDYEEMYEFVYCHQTKMIRVRLSCAHIRIRNMSTYVVCRKHMK